MITARSLTTPVAPEAGCCGSYGASGGERPNAAGQTGRVLTTLDVPLIAVGAPMPVRSGGGSCATHGLHVDCEKSSPRRSFAADAYEVIVVRASSELPSHRHIASAVVLAAG